MFNLRRNALRLIAAGALCATFVAGASATDELCDITWNELIVKNEKTELGMVAVANSEVDLVVGVFLPDDCELVQTKIILVRDPETLCDDDWSPVAYEGNVCVTINHPPGRNQFIGYANLVDLDLDFGDRACLAFVVTARCGSEEIMLCNEGYTVDDCERYSISCHEIERCDRDGGFRTQTPGGWGAPPHGGNPGAFLHSNFGLVFPGGVSIGDGDCSGDTMSFTSAQAITDFLPSSGTPGPLGDDFVDPDTADGNELASQVLALTLSVGFDLAIPEFGENSENLANLVVTSGDCAGMTVQEVLDEANNILAGCASSLSASQINDCVSAINENYVDGNSDNGFLELP
jgi:hypothetical protein